MPPKRPLSPAPSSSPSSSAAAATSSNSSLHISNPIEDRSSTFIAYFSSTTPQRQLQSHPDLKTASHRILAWRKLSTQKTLSGVPNYHTGFDDDGESYAGKKLLKLLDDYKVEGSVVVGRWYGGVLLGPVRFTHIENAAREVIRAHLADVNGEAAKKRKLDEDETRRKEMAEELKSRDESIAVLRALLDDKMGRKKEQEQKDDKEKPVSKGPDYEAMSLERLKQVDKARDNTIAFLLKKIDEIEATVSVNETQEKDSDSKVESQLASNKPIDTK